MSLQDDYFDLHSELKGLAPPLREAFDRIWDAFCECERENERLAPIVNNMRNAISAMFDEVTHDSA